MSTPFSHGSDDDLAVKRNFIEIGKRHLQNSQGDTLDQDVTIAYELSAALIYMNVADYLADYLAKGVSELVKKAVSKYYFGSIIVKSRGSKNYTIGDSIKFLSGYSFNNKDQIMDILVDVEKKRNILAHEILKFDGEKKHDIDGTIHELAKATEKLIEVIDELQPGMPPKNIQNE